MEDYVQLELCFANESQGDMQKALCRWERFEGGLEERHIVNNEKDGSNNNKNKDNISMARGKRAAECCFSRGGKVGCCRQKIKKAPRPAPLGVAMESFAGEIRTGKTAMGPMATTTGTTRRGTCRTSEGTAGSFLGRTSASVNNGHKSREETAGNHHKKHENVW